VSSKQASNLRTANRNLTNANRNLTNYNLTNYNLTNYNLTNDNLTNANRNRTNANPPKLPSMLAAAAKVAGGAVAGIAATVGYITASRRSSQPFLRFLKDQGSDKVAILSDGKSFMPLVQKLTETMPSFSFVMDIRNREVQKHFSLTREAVQRAPIILVIKAGRIILQTSPHRPHKDLILDAIGGLIGCWVDREVTPPRTGTSSALNRFNGISPTYSSERKEDKFFREVLQTKSEKGKRQGRAFVMLLDRSPTPIQVKERYNFPWLNVFYFDLGFREEETGAIVVVYKGGEISVIKKDSSAAELVENAVWGALLCF
jgi:hypothetical protein